MSAFKQQIIAGKTAEEIRASWEPGLSKYKETRKSTCCTPEHKGGIFPVFGQT
ncbi:hypothetical protein [Chitinophaga pinensis]|uniref:hypothetical protein n=1 Tax=Chitinophaga pinensis TaxID=79329 RepID=UPI0021BD4658|nr:hypothetical protein [Chitinophaga pinensis]